MGHGKWQPNIGDSYYIIYADVIRRHVWRANFIDQLAFHSRPLFKTKDEAEAALKSNQTQ
jgi:hypothetical protein